MAFTTANLSLYHSFSKMPAQNSTTLGNAINKSGHTVTASEVWAQDIPYYGKMGSLDDVKSKVQPYARKNDMCFITAGADKGKTFQYDGNGNWADITATLVDGALIKNANDDVVLLYHKGQTLTNLTADNNANTDSANNAARLWAKRDVAGATIADGGTRLIEQFVAPTDKALNGLASVAYAPVIANGSLISGTNYYDYCFSGTILWATARTTATVIDCFEYVGQKVSDVVDTVATQGATIKTHTNDISEIKATLGMSGGGDDSTPSVTERVETLEEAVETLNGTGDGSVSKAVEAGVTEAKGYTDSEIAKINTGVQTVAKAADSSELLSVSGTTDVTISLSDTVATKAYAEGQAAAAQTAAEATAAGALSAAKTELEGKITAAETAASNALTQAQTTLQGSIDGVAGRVTTAESNITTLQGQVAGLTEGDSSVASQIAAAKTELEGKITKAQGDAEATAKGYTDTEVKKVNDALTEATTKHGQDIQKVEAAIESLSTSGFSRLVVTQLPTTDIKLNAIYLVANKESDANEYVEYIYVGGSVVEGQVSGGRFEQIGTTKTDLSEYAKTADVTETLKGYTTTTVHDALATRVTTAEGTIAANTAAAAAAQAAADKAQGEVDELETAVSALSQTVASNKTTTDAAIALKADQTALDTTNVTVGEHTAAISALNTTTIPGITGRLDAIEAIPTVEVVASTAADQYITVDSETKDGKTTYTVGTTAALETRLDTLDQFLSGNDGEGLSELLAKKVDNVTGGAHGITISTANTDDGRVATLGVTADTEVTAGSANVVTSGAVQTAINTAKSALQGEIDKKVAQTAYDTKVGEIEAAIATKASAADHTALAGRVTTAEGEIDALQAFMNSGASNLIQAAIDELDGTPENAGIKVTQANGKLTALEVTPGTVEANDASVVTGGIVYAAITEAIETQSAKDAAAYAVKGTETVAANAATAAATAQTTADAKVETITTSDSRITLTPTTTDKVKSVAITLADTVATTGTDGTVYTKAEVDTKVKAVSDLVGTTAVATQITNAIAALDSEESGNGITVTLTDGKVTAVAAAAGTVAEGNTDVVTGGVVHTAVEAVKAIAEAKISAVQNDSTHFGSPLVATSGTTVTVSPAKEWSVGENKPDTEITSVFNGKMSDGSTIDDANLTDGTSMFAGSQIATFVGDLGKLTDGSQMFKNSQLVTFIAGLSSLEDGTDMFAGCHLSLESFMYIADSLPTVTGTHNIHVGDVTNGQWGSLSPDVAPFIQEMTDKGWTVQNDPYDPRFDQ